MAQPRRGKSCGPSGAHIAQVPGVNEEMGTELPHDAEGRGTSLPCKRTSGWRAESCPRSNPHPTRSPTSLPTSQQTPSSVPGTTPQRPAFGLPLPCRSLGDPQSPPKAAQHFELLKPPPAQRTKPAAGSGAQPHRQRASGSVVSRPWPRVASIITQRLSRFTPAEDLARSPKPCGG